MGGEGGFRSFYMATIKKMPDLSIILPTSNADSGQYRKNSNRYEVKIKKMTLNVLQWLPNKIKNQHVKSVNLVMLF